MSPCQHEFELIDPHYDRQRCTKCNRTWAPESYPERDAKRIVRVKARDQFIAAALTGLLANAATDELSTEEVAELAVEFGNEAMNSRDIVKDH